MVKASLRIDMEEFEKVLDSVLDGLADDILASSQQKIVDKEIIDEGTLLKSGNINRQFLEKEVVYTVPYADTIEYGRMPGSMPPIQPIKGWVRRNLGILEEQRINKIAWAIARDIEVNGTDPRPFLQPAITEATRNT